MADFELTSGSITAVVSADGATLKSVRVPDRHGELAEVTRGNTPYAGAICGRFANRIAGGLFNLDGNTYQLSRNEGLNHLHGGLSGFDVKVWAAEPYTGPGRVGVELKLVSPDGDEGYPGELAAIANYWVDQTNTLGIDFQATTDAATVVNLTNHAYWNLSGHQSGALSDHQLQVSSRRYVTVNDELIPTGHLAKVDGSMFDLADPQALENSYDHCFVLEGHDLDDGAVASLTHPGSGRSLTMTTNQPGLQIYTADHINRFGVALEAQGFPDAPNQPGFPSAVLRPGEVYRRAIRLQFGTF